MRLNLFKPQTVKIELEVNNRMNRVYAKLIATLALVLILAPIIPAGVVNIVNAQATIVGASSSAEPGGIVWVAVNVPTGNTLVQVNLTAPNGTVWRSISRVIVNPGTYNITLNLPKELPGLIDSYFTIDVEVGGTSAGSASVFVKPIVEVVPSVTTNVKVSTATGGVSNATVDVIGYGFPEGTPANYVNVSSATLTKVWDVTARGITADDCGVINITGLSFGDLLNAATLSPSPYLPRGTYDVIITTGTTLDNNETPGSLTINPIVAVTPNAGHGKWTDAITIRGYGFDANAVLTSIEFVNQNFTGIKYAFTGLYNSATNTTSKIETSSDGTFTVTTDPAATVHLVPETNMTAGMYYINVTWASSGTYEDFRSNNVFLVNATTHLWEAKNKVDDGISVYVNSTLYVNGTTEYVKIVEKTVNSYRVVAEFTFEGTLYYLVTNITSYNSTTNTANITFDLYNASATPMVLIDHQIVYNVPVDTSYSPHYFTAWYAFNLSGTFSSSAGANVSTAPSNSQFLAKYWGNYTLNVGNLYIYQRKFVLYNAGSKLEVRYNNTDTGTIKDFVITPSNSTVKLVLDNTTSTVSLSTPLEITDGKYVVDVYFNANLNLYSSTYNSTNLTITVYRGIVWQTFPTAAYIVRPYLEVLNTTVIKPGDKVMIAAFGYGPGTYKGTKNIMSIYWDQNATLPVIWAEDNLSFSGNTVAVGKDGNLTFMVQLPKDAKFGAHYLRGKDTFKYEYTLLVVIGAASYWAKVTGVTTQWIVTAKHPEYGRIVATVCKQYAGCKYCGIKVVSGPKTETLGDIIKITLYGIKKSDITAVYFGNVKITDYNVTEGANVVNITFVVPTVPEGKYPLRVETTQTTIQVMYFYNGTLVPAEPEVVPKVLIVSLNDVHKIPVLVGPGFVKVIGTGFPPGASVKTVTVNGTDALYTLNTQVANWYANNDGVLEAYGNLTPGLFIPALEPGVYEIGLAFQTPTGSEISQPGLVYVVNNLTKIVTSDEFNAFANDVTTTLNSISGSVSVLGSKLDALVGQVSSLSSSVNGLAASISGVSSDVKDLKSAVSDLKSSISSLSGSVSNILSDTAAIKGDLATLKNMVSNIKLSVDLTPITSKLDSISSQLSDIKSSLGKLSELDTINNNVQSAISAANAAKSAASNAASAANAAKSAAEAASNAIGNVKTVLASKIDSATYVLYVATIFALLAFIFGILSWATARKAAAS